MRRAFVLVAFFLAVTILSGSALIALSPKEIYQNAANAVVLIMSSDFQDSKVMVGSGSLIAKDGSILTNRHVIYNSATGKIYSKIHIFFKPEQVTGDLKNDLKNHLMAEVSLSDENMDLAVLKVKLDTPRVFRNILQLGNPEKVTQGDPVVALGHPEQGGFWTLTAGIVSALLGDFGKINVKSMIQIDTNLNRGNSGGPLIDQRGYMVGVNAEIARKADDGLAITGINFAIRSDVVKKWLDAHNIHIPYGPEKTEAGPAPAGETVKGDASPAPVVPAALKPGSAGNTAKTGRSVPVEVFHQEKHPYKIDSVYKKFLEMEKSSDAAVDEMNKALEEQKKKEGQE